MATTAISFGARPAGNHAYLREVRLPNQTRDSALGFFPRSWNTTPISLRRLIAIEKGFNGAIPFHDRYMFDGQRGEWLTILDGLIDGPSGECRHSGPVPEIDRDFTYFLQVRFASQRVAVVGLRDGSLLARHRGAPAWMLCTMRCRRCDVPIVAAPISDGARPCCSLECATGRVTPSAARRLGRELEATFAAELGRDQPIGNGVYEAEAHLIARLSGVEKYFGLDVALAHRCIDWRETAARQGECGDAACIYQLVDGSIVRRIAGEPFRRLAPSRSKPRC